MGAVGYFNANVNSTSFSTGTLIVPGVGISSNVYTNGTVNVGGVLNATSANASTSPSTGGAVITGGLGVLVARVILEAF